MLFFFPPRVLRYCCTSGPLGWKIISWKRSSAWSQIFTVIEKKKKLKNRREREKFILKDLHGHFILHLDKWLLIVVAYRIYIWKLKWMDAVEGEFLLSMAVAEFHEDDQACVLLSRWEDEISCDWWRFWVVTSPRFFFCFCCFLKSILFSPNCWWSQVWYTSISLLISVFNCGLEYSLWVLQCFLSF